MQRDNKVFARIQYVPTEHASNNKPQHRNNIGLRFGSSAFVPQASSLVNFFESSKENETGIFGVARKKATTISSPSKSNLQFNWGSITDDDTMQTILQFATKTLSNCKELAKMIVEAVRNEKLEVDPATRVSAFLEKSEVRFFPDLDKQGYTSNKVFKDIILQELQKSFEEYFAEKPGSKYTFNCNKEHTLDILFIGTLYSKGFIDDKIKDTLIVFFLQKFLKEYNFHINSYEKDPKKPHEHILKNIILFFQTIKDSVEELEASRLERQKFIINFGDCLKQIQNDAYEEIFAQDTIIKGFAAKDLIEILEMIRDRIYPLSNEILELIEKEYDLYEKGRSSDTDSNSIRERSEIFEEEDFKENEIEVQSPEKDQKEINLNSKPKESIIQAEIKTSDANSKELDDRLKKIYQRIPEKDVIDMEKAIKGISKIAIDFGGLNILRGFYRTFHAGKEENIKTRLFIPTLLLEGEFISNEEFLKEFEEAIFRMSQTTDQYPTANINFATIFLKYCEKVGDLSPFERIKFPAAAYIKNNPLYSFYHIFFRALIESLSTDFQDLQSKVKKDTLRNLVTKLNVDKAKSETIMLTMIKSQKITVARKIYEDHFQGKKKVAKHDPSTEKIGEKIITREIENEMIQTSIPNQVAEEAKTESYPFMKNALPTPKEQSSIKNLSNEKADIEEINLELEEIYKNLSKREFREKRTLENIVKFAANKFGAKNILICFYKTFYKINLKAIKERLIIPNLLSELKLIKDDDFLAEFQQSMKRMSEIAYDYPKSGFWLATIFLNYCKFIGDLSPLKKISFTNEFYYSKDSGVVLEFYQEFFRVFCEILKDNSSNFEEKTKQDALRQFSKKIETKYNVNAGMKSNIREDRMNEEAEKIILVKAAKRWQPEIRKESVIRFYLNILTDSKFEFVKCKLLELASQGVDDCKLIAALVISNARGQPLFTDTYCHLCTDLGRSQKLFFNKGKNQFRSYILDLVQKSFHKHDQPSSDLNSKLIGKLFLANFFKIDAIHIVAMTKLQNFLKFVVSREFRTKNSENSLKDLLKLYKIIGKSIQDKEDSKESNVLAQNAEKIIEAVRAAKHNKPFPDFSKLKLSSEGIFKILGSILDLIDLSPRLGYKIKDLIQTKKKWARKGIIKEELKQIYNTLDHQQTLTNPDELHRVITNLVAKFSGKEVLYCFYQTFYDGRIKSVERRLFIPNLLVNTQMVTEEEFFNDFKFAMQRVSESACDYPELETYFAMIILNYSSEINDLAYLPKILLTQEAYQNELPLLFYQSFARSLFQLLNHNYPKLLTKGNTDNLIYFTSQLKLDIYTMSFMSKFIKKRLSEVMTLSDPQFAKEGFLEVASSSMKNCEIAVRFILKNVSMQKDFTMHVMLYEFLENSRKLYFDDPPTDQGRRKNVKYEHFKMQFLNKIQRLFEDYRLNNSSHLHESLGKRDIEKLKLLRLIRFIGQLYDKKLLMAGIIYSVTTSLLKKFLQEYALFKDDSQRLFTLPYEDTLEVLTELYSSIGQSLKDKENLKGVDNAKYQSGLTKFDQCLKLAMTKSQLDESEIMIINEEISMNCLLSIFDTIVTQVPLSQKLESRIKDLLALLN